MGDIILNDMMETLQVIDISEYIDTNRYIYNGNAVPRVTEIISSMTNKEFLMYWAMSLAKKHKSLEAERTFATDIGTLAHLLIEEFINRGEVFPTELIEETDDTYTNTIKKHALHSFNSWISFYNENIKKRNIKILYTEDIEICPYYGCTIDAIGVDPNGNYKLYDWKTSKAVGMDYFIQLAAYKYILELNKGFRIDELNVVQINKNIYNPPVANIYSANIYKDSDFINHCTNTFIGMVYSYYNKMYCENYFKVNSNKNMRQRMLYKEG